MKGINIAYSFINTRCSVFYNFINPKKFITVFCLHKRNSVRIVRFSQRIIYNLNDLVSIILYQIYNVVIIDHGIKFLWIIVWVEYKPNVCNSVCICICRI